MIVGCLGDIVFSVSQRTIKTLRDVAWQGSASIQSHKRHLNVDLPEFVGSDLDSITFSIRLSKFLGVSNPMSDIARLLTYERSGTALPLTIGEKGYGRYRWLISKHKVSLEQYDKIGNVVTADVSLTLTEYPEE